jgi:hypothetical protein
VISIDSFLDELTKIAQVGREGPYSAPMDVPKPPSMSMGALTPTPSIKPPKPPVAETVKSLARKGGTAIKMLDKVISAPQAPHRFGGVSYNRNFSGFKYS